MHTEMNSRGRWHAPGVLCLGSLLIVLDTTIVNVALPSIRADLHFSATSLAWAGRRWSCRRARGRAGRRGGRLRAGW